MKALLYKLSGGVGVDKKEKLNGLKIKVGTDLENSIYMGSKCFICLSLRILLISNKLSSIYMLVKLSTKIMNELIESILIKI